MEPSLAAVDGPQELHGRKLALVFTGLMLVMLMAALDATIVATALPTIAGDLGGLNHISWVAHGVPAGADRGHPALREARRPIWGAASSSRSDW